MKKHLFTAVRALVAAAGIAYILWSVTWSDQTRVLDGQVVVEPGVLTMLRNADVPLLLLGLVVMGPIYPILALRWMLLMRARELHVSFGKAFRLVMVGSFFNYCMPVGTTGGDVAKAYYAARGSGRTTDAVMSVVVDRIMGMLGLILVGGLAGLFMLDNPVVRHISGVIWLIAAGLTVGAIAYFSQWLRRVLGINWILARVPAGKLLRRIDDAAVAYRLHKMTLAAAFALSTVIHCCIIASTILAGKALGITHPTEYLLGVIPVLLLVAAIPITYQGLGVMEGAGKPLLVQAGFCTANQMVGMLMLYRLYMVAYSLLGALFLLRGDIHLHPQSQSGQRE